MELLITDPSDLFETGSYYCYDLPVKEEATEAIINAFAGIKPVSLNIKQSYLLNKRQLRELARMGIFLSKGEARVKGLTTAKTNSNFSLVLLHEYMQAVFDNPKLVNKCRDIVSRVENNFNTIGSQSSVKIIQEIILNKKSALIELSKVLLPPVYLDSLIYPEFFIENTALMVGNIAFERFGNKEEKCQKNKMLNSLQLTSI